MSEITSSLNNNILKKSHKNSFFKYLSLDSSNFQSLFSESPELGSLDTHRGRTYRQCVVLQAMPISQTHVIVEVIFTEDYL